MAATQNKISNPPSRVLKLNVAPLIKYPGPTVPESQYRVWPFHGPPNAEAASPNGVFMHERKGVHSSIQNNNG